MKMCMESRLLVILVFCLILIPRSLLADEEDGGVLTNIALPPTLSLERLGQIDPCDDTGAPPPSNRRLLQAETGPSPCVVAPYIQGQ
ncbi:hypothetical protein CTI12_AA552600 [Artemisia annua]|uniref:Uncharacterized protein n=1 Tax=Artemisia annua TaxID=35608 RepID=A0A2U1KXX9_ARTAN|nr:hypothetical protein CTI12_AA552600 [Artemisia annua]